MDTELRLISRLLSANRTEQDEFWNKQLPLNVYALREQEMGWLMSYREKHGKFPSPRTFELRFDEELKPVDDPLSVVAEPVISQAAYTQLKGIIDKTSMMFQEKENTDDILDYFRTSATAIQSFGQTSYVDEALSDPNIALRRYADVAKRKDDPSTFMRSPWNQMNKMLNFVRPGELVSIAARLGMGKSWGLFHWMDFLASQGISTLIFSKEMPTQQCADRITALRFKLEYEAFRTMTLDIDQMVNWKIRARRAAKKPYPLLVSGEETFEGTGLEQLYAKVQRVKPRVVAIDGAYLLNVKSVSRNATDQEKFAAISRGAKRLAKVTNTAVFAVIQMNRSAEDKKGKTKGGVTTVFGADAWAQDSDVLIEISGDRGANERLVSIHKSRETRIGDFPINFSFSPFPDFSEKPSLTGGDSAAIKFKPLA